MTWRAIGEIIRWPPAGIQFVLLEPPAWAKGLTVCGFANGEGEPRPGHGACPAATWANRQPIVRSFGILKRVFITLAEEGQSSRPADEGPTGRRDEGGPGAAAIRDEHGVARCLNPRQLRASRGLDAGPTDWTKAVECGGSLQGGQATAGAERAAFAALSLSEFRCGPASPELRVSRPRMSRFV
jgi:hypothetical protein